MSTVFVDDKLDACREIRLTKKNRLSLNLVFSSVSFIVYIQDGG